MVRLIAFGLFLVSLIPTAAEAARGRRSLGLAGVFYTGKKASSIAAPLAGGFAFSSYHFLGKWVYLKHRFGLEGMVGQKFAGDKGAYIGIVGTYDFNIRLNLANSDLQPYLEAGPILGVFVIRLTGPDDATSTNQGSLKYGYIVGTGFDWSGKSYGFGINVSYFKYLKSPSIFEFPAASLDAQGVRLELKFLWNS